MEGNDNNLNHLRMFEYSDLPDERSFRILELLPGEPHEDISVRLHNAHWDNAPVYDALSYVWGDAAVTKPIICDGQRLDCTPSLISFLRSLRSPPLPRRSKSKREKLWPWSKPKELSTLASRFLWADAICINQFKTRERSHQVNNMIDIYRHAKCVHIWLGPGISEDETVTVFKCIRLLSDKLCNLMNTSIAKMKKVRDVYEVLWSQSSELPSLTKIEDSGYVKPLRAIFASPWFTRLWVVQEVNSNENCWVHFGSQSVEWLRVLLVACLLRLRYYEHDSAFSGTFFSLAKTIGVAFQPKTQAASMLRSASRFHCKDERDKIYGLLGILRRENAYFPLEVDYNKSVLEVYMDAMELFLASDDRAVRSSGLVILYQVSYAGTPGWPSWVVQWNQKVDDNLFNSRTVNVAGNMQASPKIERTDNTLTLDGFVLDVVSATKANDNPMLDWNLINRKRCKDFFLSWLSILSLTREGQDAFVAGAMALTGGRDHRAEKVDPMIHGSNFRAFIDELLGSDHTYIGELSAEAQSFLSAMYVCTTGSTRCFFGTGTGFKGCTRQMIVPGDLVCILFGARAAFILRRHNDGYLLIDQAYVYGIMDGEIVKDWQEGKLPCMEQTTFKIY